MPPATAAEGARRQEPMEVVSSRGENTVVSTQFTSEPCPSPNNQPQMTLRGGGIFCGFDCCNGACRFHKNCC